MNFFKSRRKNAAENDTSKSSNPSFTPIQAKLKVGEANDKYEKEADSIASKVVNNGGLFGQEPFFKPPPKLQRSSESAQVQEKPIGESITPLVQKQEAEEPVQMMAEEEPVQKAQEEESVQKAEEEEPVQMKEEEESVQKAEEEEPVQMKEEEESVQKAEEEEPVQMKEDEEPVQMMEEEEPVQKAEEEEPVQKAEEEEVQKKAATGSAQSTSVESRLNSSKGSGQKLSGDTKNEMESGFGADFSNVNIHTDQNAADLSQDLGAKAFAHGNDVYFNKGQYNPKSSEGKHLLAHELTHTIQQKGMVQKQVQRHMQKSYPWPGIIANSWSAALRGKPSMGNFIMNIPKSSVVTVQSNVQNWLYVKYSVGGKTHTGYISQELVNYDSKEQNRNDALLEQKRKREKADDKNKFNQYPSAKESTGWLFSEKGTQTATATSLPELGALSLLNYDVVYLKGQILEKIKKDPDMVQKQLMIINEAKANKNYRVSPFYISGSKLVGFGGQRWKSSTEDWGSTSSENPILHKETWAVGGNELTWALRNATVRYWIDVDKSGSMTITYHLNDRLDLSGSKGRSDAYSNISEFMGFFYHDLAGGNENLLTRAEWSVTVK